jgi:class 3 adenylate cyclase
MQTEGASMIVTVEFDEPDNVRKLMLLGYLRALFALRVWSDSVHLVKTDGNRFFVFARSAGEALEAALTMKKLVLSFHTWIGEVFPDGKALPDAATLKAGIHHGSILLIEGDCYGNPVNVASKLGEDIGLSGEVLVSTSSTQNVNDACMQGLKSNLVLEPRQTEISGVSLNYCRISVNNLYEGGATVPMPPKGQVETYVGGVGSSELSASELVIMTTDMSGFTRLTKQYGILHFLRLVLKARSIVLPALQKHGGWKVKYEGDNIIAAFPTVNAAIACIRGVVQQISEYNSVREKDFQVRMGFGVDVGEVHCLGHDIVGKAFDCSFRLAEDIAEVGEVLVTDRITAAGWPAVPHCNVSEEKMLEDGNVKYYAMMFDD